MNNNFNELLHKIVEPISNNSLCLTVLEERLYLKFGGIENKIDFIKYTQNEFLPYYKDLINGYENNEIESNYLRNLAFFENKKYCFIENWFAEKSNLFLQKNLQQIEPVQSNVSDLMQELNPFPMMFINETVYKCFLLYKKHIIDVYTDYSYLKKRLENLKLIHKHTDNDFMNFLLNDIKFITKKDFENYTYKYESKLKSLAKSYSEQRHNNFNIVFEKLL